MLADLAGLFSDKTALIMGATSLMTLLLTKGVEALLKLRADRRIDIVRTGDETETTLKYIIKRQDDRIADIEKSYAAMSGKHSECEKSLAVLTERLATIEKELKGRTENTELLKFQAKEAAALEATPVTPSPATAPAASSATADNETKDGAATITIQAVKPD